MAASIAEIVVLCLLADWLCRRIRMPGLVGMLVVGMLLGPHVLGWLDPDLLAIGPDLRLIALIVILLRAGFELSRATLHRTGGRVLLLAFIPATLEGTMVALTAPLILGLTRMEAVLLGTILAAVSPAVVVPSMIRLITQRRGADKDIPSMIMAAASVDDIFVIVAHGAAVALFLGRRVNIAAQLAMVPLSLLLGIGAGLLTGTLLYKLFDRINPRATKRVLVILAISILLVRLEHLLAGYVPFAGLVAAMAIGFVILERREHMAHEISARLAKIWVLAEIVLFAMVGAQVDLGIAWRAGLAGTAVILLGLTARACGVLTCLAGSRLNRRERLFAVVAYSPKATVQAAIGASPLLAMRAAGMDTAPGELILAVAVLAIVMTAPTGAWAIRLIGDRVLSHDPATARDAYDAAMESGGAMD